MKTVVPAALAFAIVAAAGATHGDWTGRWGYSDELSKSPERLARVPLAVGEWRGKDVELTEKQKGEFRGAELVGHLFRSYVNTKTGDTVTILLVSGLPGPITTHVPETCFKGTGYEMSEAPKTVDLAQEGAGATATFFSGEFAKRDSDLAPKIRVLWSWLDKGRWRAAEVPRTAFINSRCLYKLYAVQELPVGFESDPSGGPVAAFVKALLPALDEDLVSFTPR